MFLLPSWTVELMLTETYRSLSQEADLVVFEDMAVKCSRREQALLASTQWNPYRDMMLEKQPQEPGLSRL